MAAAPILKIVCSYLDVLQAVRRCHSLNWDENSFSNAFKWAKLCRKSKNKSYASQLNEEIKKLPWKFDGLQLDLNALESSLDILILALLYNKNVKLDIFKLKKLLDMTRENEGSMAKHVEHLLEVKVAMSCLGKSGKACRGDVLNTATKALVQLLIHFSTSYPFTTKLILERLLVELALTDNGYRVFEESFKVLQKLRSCSGDARLKGNISIMNSLLQNYFVNNWGFLSTHKTFTNVFACDHFLLKSFLNSFFSLGKKFDIKYKDTVDNTFPLFLWIVKDDKEFELLSYDWLKEWLVYLLEHPSEFLVCSVQRELFRLASCSNVNVWLSICQDIDRMDLIL